MNTVTQNYHDHVRRDVFRVVPKTGGVLLDFGGGIGATAATLKAEGYAETCGVADLVADSASAELDFRVTGNLEDPDVIETTIRDHGPFDLILCLDILEHLRDPWSTVAALHQGLKPGGRIVASIPNVSHYSALLPLALRGKWTLRDDGILDRTHLRFFVKDTAVELMTSSGLALETVVGNRSPGIKAAMLHWALLGLMPRLTNLQYLVRVRRD